MARKLRSEAAAEALGARTARVDGASFEVDGVRSVAVQARPLYTFDSKHPVWKLDTAVDCTRIAGAIVRLEPPAELTDVQIDNVRSAFVAAGAVAVRMLPKLSAGQVVAPERTEDRSSVASVRSVVMKMVDEARVTDREAVRSIVEKVLAEEGL